MKQSEKKKVTAYSLTPTVIQKLSDEAYANRVTASTQLEKLLKQRYKIK